MKNTFNSMELITPKQASRICGMDAPSMSSQPAKFVKDNEEVWYVAMNTWLLIIDDLSSRTRRLVQDGINRHGLLYMIREGDAVAERIMHSHSDGSDTPDLGYYFNYLVADLAESVDAERQLLTVLRFCKRLSPLGADLIRKDSIKKFLDINSHNREKYRVEDAPICNQKPMITNKGIEVTTSNKTRFVMDYDLDKHYLWRDIVSVARELMPQWFDIEPTKGVDIIHSLESYTHGDDGCRSYTMLSTGSTYEHAKVTNDKIGCLAMHYRQVVPDCLMYPLGNERKYVLNDSVKYVSKNQKDVIFSQKASYDPDSHTVTHFHKRKTKGERYEDYLISSRSVESLPNVCRIVAVPKSFKTSRIIAMEQTWRGYVLQALRHDLVSQIRNSAWHPYLDVEDQEPNQDWAWRGSVDRSYCTIDLSGASDSIDDVIGYALCPRLADFWDEIRSRWLQVDGKMVRSNIFLTSGTPVTFILESIFFLSVAVACTRYVQTFTEERLLPPRTFGDDLELDSRVYDTICDVLANLGFTVNQSKSFSGDTNYRESCGVEYLDGYPLHTIKWPRNEFRVTATGFTPEALGSLTSLQHKLYHLSWSAQYFLACYIQHVERGMTSSHEFVDGDDLWSHDPEYGVRKAPHAGEFSSCEEGDPWYREAHCSLVSKTPEAPYPLSQDTEMYNYVQFLVNGPRYATKFDELLKISEPLDRKVQYALPSASWKRIVR